MTVLAACRRASILALAVVSGGVVIDVVRHWLDGPERIVELVSRTATDYEAIAIVAEPDSVVGQALTTAAMPFLSITVSAAKRQLLATSDQHLHGRLYEMLVQDHPQLRRFVRIDPRTGQVPTADRWRTVPLLAAALGLGATTMITADTLYPN